MNTDCPSTVYIPSHTKANVKSSKDIESLPEISFLGEMLFEAL